MINPKDIIKDYKKYLGIDISIKDIPNITKFKNSEFSINKLSDGYYIYKTDELYYNFKNKKFQKWNRKNSVQFCTNDVMDCLEVVYDSKYS